MRTVPFVAALLLTVPVLARNEPQPFKAGTEVVAIEVTAIDADGNPVPDLGIADFTVLVAGRPRSIQSAQFIRTEPASVMRPPREAGVSTNTLPTSGRMLLLVVDESNLRMGACAPSASDRAAPRSTVARRRRRGRAFPTVAASSSRTITPAEGAPFTIVRAFRYEPPPK